jgi:hypothetical protein
MKKFTKAELRKRAFRRAASAAFSMWEEKGTSDTRLLETMMIPDELVTVGESLEGNDYREHVVPRMMLLVHCHETIFREHADDETVAVEKAVDLFERYLKIMRISGEKERPLLDDSDKGNLKTSMPDDWTFEGGSPFARLDAVGIKYRFYEESE